MGGLIGLLLHPEPCGQDEGHRVPLSATHLYNRHCSSPRPCWFASRESRHEKSVVTGLANIDSASPFSPSGLACLPTPRAAALVPTRGTLEEPHRIASFEEPESLVCQIDLVGAYKPPSFRLLDRRVHHHSSRSSSSSGFSVRYTRLIPPVSPRPVLLIMSLKGIMQNVLTNGLGTIVRNATMPQQHVAVLG